MVYKHWLTYALYYLYYEEADPKLYLNYLQNIARRFIFDRFLAREEGESYYDMIFEREDEYFPVRRLKSDINPRKLRFGEIENNFVFNYLDYLLWLRKKDKDPVAKEFEFTFRSSVEHFYPQHPMDGHPAMESDELHQFGNLCLISHSKNSRLSNFPPKAKLAHFSPSIKERSIDSLKLYEMVNLAEQSGNWGEPEIIQHGTQMEELLLASTNSDTELLRE